MTAANFRRIALGWRGWKSTPRRPAGFSCGGRKFASLARRPEDTKISCLPPEQQAAFVEEAPAIFLPILAASQDGHTHIRLAAASADVLTGALRTAWKLRMDQNAKTGRQKPIAKRSGVTNKKRGTRQL